MAEVSNKTLISIVLLSLTVTLFGMWVLYGKIQTTGLASNPTGTVSANVQSTVDIFLQNNTINFGSVGVGQTFDTTVNYSNSSQFLVRNDGSVFVNITVGASYLWNSTCSQADNYELNVTNASGNTSILTNCGPTFAYTQNTWTDMLITSVPGGSGCSPAIARNRICNLNFSDANDYARMDVRITVPTGEGAGAHTSTVTFTASQA